MTEPLKPNRFWIEIRELPECDLEDEYYHLKAVAKKQTTSTWWLHARICRKDSGEQIGGVTGVTGPDADNLIPQLQAAMAERLAALPRPPHQWGQVEIRRLLTDYRALNNSLTNILVELHRRLESGALSGDDLHDAYWAARNRATQGAMALARRLDKLSEQDCIDLMTASEEVYAEPTDAWHLDELDGRDVLFGYLDNPSEAVIAAHSELLARLESEE